MKQHDGKCPVEQKDDLARKTPGLVWWAHICKQRAQPVLYAENGGAKLDHGSGGEVLLRAA